MNITSHPSHDDTPKVHIETWGCQMNVADSERMLALLARHGFQHVSEPGKADLIILNTCNIREKARHKVLTRLGELRRFKQEKPNLILAVSGCIAQVEAESLSRDVPFLDLIFGPDHIEELPKMLEKVKPQGHGRPSPVVDTSFQESGTYTIPFDEAEPWTQGEAFEASRFINIIKGCNNFCSYCVVPYTRGREKSRPAEEIEQEGRFFLERGVKELVLLGQNVNSYGLDLVADRTSKEALERTPFIDLLHRVAALPGLTRLRFVTSNPHDFSTALPKAFASLPNLCDQLHLPVQSGSDRVLKAMNRRYTRGEYLEKVAAVRAVRPEMAFSTDVIVGFPGESQSEFEETLSLLEKAGFASLFAFKYSPRPLTAAARMADAVSESDKDARLQAVLDLQKRETLRQNHAEIGKVREVLIVYKSQREERTWYGRSFAGRLVKVTDTEARPGEIFPVRIERATLTAIEGRRA